MKSRNLQEWEVTGVDWTLRDREVHIWKFDLEAHPEMRTECLKVLSEDERKKADQFKFNLHADRYILSRGILRYLLGRYLQMPSSQVQIEYNAFGKPYCSGKVVFFNASHSENLLIVGISKSGDLGVDMEFMNRNMEEMLIANRFFSAAEIQQFNILEASGKMEAFYSCWTKKEAYIKAKGKGLSIPLHSFTVDIAFQAKSCLQSSEHPEDEGSSFCFYSFFPCEQVIACLATPTDDLILKFFDGSHILHEKCEGSRSLIFF